MMIKMLIVDDEPVICQGLTATIPWNDIGVEVIGTAYDSKEALSFMHRENIDLVLTDVYMPEMNGLELSEHIAHKFPESKIIMLSGYDEFEYARQAMRLGVEDYLLKPVDIDDLLELVTKVRRAIIAQKKEEELFKQEVISQQILHYLFGSPISTKVRRDSDQMMSSYRIIMSELSDYYIFKETYTEKELTRLREAWKLQVDQAFSHFEIETISMFGHENELITIPYNNDGFELDDEQIVNVCESIAKVKGNSLRNVVSTEQQDLSAIPQLREKMQTMLEDCRIDDKHMIFSEGDCEETGQITYPKKIEVRLQEAILEQDQVLMKDLFDELFQRIEKEKLNLKQVLNITCELVSVLNDRLLGQHDVDHLEKVNQILHRDVDLKIYNSTNGIKHLFTTAISYLAETIEAKKDHHWIIESAKKYIQENYQRDIKASDVAEQHLITPNYFSMLFKQETGHSYSEYLNMLRIKKASELLVMESDKVYEIAEYVGYKEYKYFAHIFKTQLGMTPTEYRRTNIIGK